MLHGSATRLYTALYLVCFLIHVGFVTCRSTARYSEYNAGLTGACLRSCGFLIAEHEPTESKMNPAEPSNHQTCFEKCLEIFKKDKMVLHEKSSSTSGKQILNPFLRARRKRSASADIGKDIFSLCPKNGQDENHFAEIKNVERRQYENSSTWYLNITWDPINVKRLANFTGYAFIYSTADVVFGFINRQKNESYVIFNESGSNWSDPDYFLYFNVLARPCLTPNFIGEESWKDLNDYLPAPTPTDLTPSTVSPTKGAGVTAITIIAIIAGVATVGILLLIIGIAYRLRRRKTSLPSSKKIESSRAPGFTYDAFIIFNQKDQEWVESKVLRLLEEKHGFKCCVHYRDFEVGTTFVQNMSKSVEVSRKVIAVASRHFFESNFCNFELEQAIYKQATEHENFIIVIRKDDVSNDKLPAALKERSFIDYSNKVERKSWNSKLVKALESN